MYTKDVLGLIRQRRDQIAFLGTLQADVALECPDNERTVPSDGKICKNESGELAVTKFAVEPAWYLPGVAERFGIGEFTDESMCPLVPARLTRCR